MPLTDTAVKNLKSGDKTTKHSDGGGLFLMVTPHGSKLWKMAYRFRKTKDTFFRQVPNRCVGRCQAQTVSHPRRNTKRHAHRSSPQIT